MLFENQTNYIPASKITDIRIKGIGNFTPQNEVSKVEINVDDIIPTAQIIDNDTVQLNLSASLKSPKVLRYRSNFKIANDSVLNIPFQSDDGYRWHYNMYRLLTIFCNASGYNM